MNPRMLKRAMLVNANDDVLVRATEAMAIAVVKP
jgi:hypothetical protein